MQVLHHRVAVAKVEPRGILVRRHLANNLQPSKSAFNNEPSDNLMPRLKYKRSNSLFLRDFPCSLLSASARNLPKVLFSAATKISIPTEPKHYSRRLRLNFKIRIEKSFSFMFQTFRLFRVQSPFATQRVKTNQMCSLRLQNCRSY